MRAEVEPAKTGMDKKIALFDAHLNMLDQKQKLQHAQECRMLPTRCSIAPHPPCATI